MSRSIDRQIDNDTIRAYHQKFSTTPEWMSDAECSLNDDGSLDPIRDREIIAQQYCPKCPVIEQCREFGDRHSIKVGVFGGVVRNPDSETGS